MTVGPADGSSCGGSRFRREPLLGIPTGRHEADEPMKRMKNEKDYSTLFPLLVLHPLHVFLLEF
jgi:hypothetical protein